MNALIDLVSNSIQNSGATAVFFDAALKSFVVLGLAAGVCLCWRRASAATRHLIWFLAVVSLPCLPLLSPLLPSWQQPLWSISTGFDSRNQFSMALEFAPTAEAKHSGDQGQAPVAQAPATPGKPSGTQPIAAHFSEKWLVLGIATWCGGVLLGLFSVAAARLRLCELTRQAQMLQDPDWRTLVHEVCGELHIRQPVTLLQSAENVMPMTWGWWRAVVLLPAEATEWSPERRRVVLQHELAHVKRWDCLTRSITRIVCAFYWFNPLVWLAGRRMCVDRERACDDLVLIAGWKASDYASHLVEIARTFQRVPQVAAIAMARSSQLEKRVAAIVDVSRNRRLRPVTILAVLVMTGGMVLSMGGCKTAAARGNLESSKALRRQQIARLKAFSAAKEKQSQTLAAAAGEPISAEFQRFFEAARSGDWQTVSNIDASFMERHPEYTNILNADASLRISYWQPVLEITMAYECVASCEPKYTQTAADDIVNSIPAGSIYFGGTDPGRGLPTAFCRSHVDADPFFTLTQNALADRAYLLYLRTMYGGRIYTPTDEDAEKCSQEYRKDAERRARHDTVSLKEPKQLKPGENVRIIKEANQERVQVSGAVAVMLINGLMAKLVFDRNPNKEFFVEESFPFDWMYPHLSPHGLIMKVNRQPLSELTDEMVRRDHEYWTKLVKPMIGDWITYDTPVPQVAAFAEKVYLKHDFSGFKGDARYVQNADSQHMFSKLRASIGGMYAWRRAHATSESEKTRTIREADFTFRQAWALCPHSPEAVFRYVQFLLNQGRIADALVIAETAAKVDTDNPQMRGLVTALKQAQKRAKKAN
jgi:beta-lactamase regulating signal transducer with metallopeptidase domain